MKKIINLSAITILALSIVSCSKTSSGYLPSTSGSQVSTIPQPVSASAFFA